MNAMGLVIVLLLQTTKEATADDGVKQIRI